MTLEEAIKHLNHEVSLKNPLLGLDTIAALNLAIHALKRIQDLRLLLTSPGIPLLPGETLIEQKGRVMTIEDAIEILTNLKIDFCQPPESRIASAFDLALEALHRQQQIRKSGTPWFRGPLEGETIE